jgi:hypothetical protein
MTPQREHESTSDIQANIRYVGSGREYAKALAWAVIGVGVAALAVGCALALRWDLDGGRWA